MSLRAPAAFVAVALCGCHGCHDSHPYVPYTIGPAEAAATVRTDAGPGSAASAPTPDAGEASAFTGTDATPAPPSTTRWPIQRLVLDAPQGLVFVSAVVRDVDGDGNDDAFALARPAEGNDPGVLAFYRGQPGAAPLAPSATFPPPGDLARSASCTPVDRLVLVGPYAVLAELGAQCPLHATTSPDRWVAIVSASGATPRVRLAMTVADPPGAPALSVDGDTSDRDGDGLPDVALRVTLEGGGAPLEPGPRVSATFAWLDRPAGLSRDQGATEASFAALASSAASLATRAADAPSVPAFVTQVRALWRAVCPDGGSPRIVGVAGAGAVPCGAARALEQAGLAEVHAYVTMGDPLHAALALDGTPAASASRAAAEARRWIETLAPTANARLVRPVLAVPVVPKGHEPSWGSLAFETSGKLLVRTRAGVVRVDPDEGDEGAADDVPAWRPAVVSPDGATRWVEAYDPCDGLALRATFASGDDMRDLALPVPPPMGARCAGSRGALARVIPIAWGPGGLEAIVGDGPVIITADLEHAVPLAGLLGQPGTLGAPLSPDGKTLVVPTSAGLLVRSPDRTRLLRAPELDGTYADQRDCTVSNEASHVACVHAGRAWVGAWD